MLKITLYKRTVLNKEYNYVFSLGKIPGDNITVFEKYLDSLINETYNIDYAYYTNSGEFILDYNIIAHHNIYDFNYLKVVELDDETGTQRLIRYCFIDNISIKHDYCIIYYSEDIWHSYSHKITGIKSSYLSNSRILNYANKQIGLRTLPVLYDGNENLVINKENNNSFCILVNVQYYNASTYGTSTNRYYRSFLLKKVKRYCNAPPAGSNLVSYDTPTENSWNFSIQEVYDCVNEIVTFQSGKKFFHTDSNISRDDSSTNNLYFHGIYFQIESFIVVPSYFIGTLYFEDVDVHEYAGSYGLYTDYIGRSGAEFTNQYTTVYACCELKEIRKNTFLSNFTASYNSDFKRLSIGTLNTQVPTIENGTGFSIKVEYVISDDNIKFYFNILNQLIDITEDFRYVVPFTSVLGEENSLIKMNKNLKDLSAVLGIGYELFSSGVGVVSTIGLQKSLTNRINLLKYTKSGRLTTSRTRLEKAEKLENQLDSTSILDNFEGSGDIFSNIISLIKNNAPVYTSLKGNFAKSTGIFNAKCGITEMKISPDNSDYVIKSINNGGYNVFEIIDDISLIDLENTDHFDNIHATYNFIKFGYVDVYGSFPNDIAIELNEILEKGIKIWYDYQMTEDNYVV